MPGEVPDEQREGVTRAAAHPFGALAGANQRSAALFGVVGSSDLIPAVRTKNGEVTRQFSEIGPTEPATALHRQ